MSTRIIVAGILGGVAMFIWTSIAHMVLPLGEAGVREIPDQQTVLGCMSTSIGDKAGLYIFPGMGLGPDATREQKKEAMRQMGENYAKNPSGLLIYHPAGRPLAIGKLLGVEFATEVLEAILAVSLLAQTRLSSFGARVGFVTVAGILAALATNVSYWNWYGFPAVYTGSYMSIQVIGFLCAGIVAALVMGRRTAAT